MAVIVVFVVVKNESSPLLPAVLKMPPLPPVPTCNVYDADESYTSMTCTKCGDQSKEYDKQRIKQCKCGYKIDRDCNGSRNILLKCLKSLIPV